MASFYVYRNCFTGDISGGDMHTSGFCDWIYQNQKLDNVSIIHAEDDGQEGVYNETKYINNITYRDSYFSKKSLALGMFIHAWKGSKVNIPSTDEPLYLVAGSHLFGDVFPVFMQTVRAPRVERVVYIHHVIQAMPRKRNINKVIANIQEKICFYLIKKRFDKIITGDNDVEPQLRKRGFKQPILLSSNFVDPVKSSGMVLKDIDLAFCGRLVKQKGIYDFLNICNDLQKTRNIKAIVMGAGPEMQKIKALAKASEADITIAGRVSEKDKYMSYRRSKVFLFPSIEEGWGIAIAESLSVGTPVVAYNLPIYKHVFKDNLQYVKLNDYATLLKTTSNMLDMFSSDKVKYDNINNSISKYASRFRRDNVIKNEYQFIINGSK